RTRMLAQGVDVWLNNPRRPLEASGTSGRKVCANGGLNLSILDGWWVEGYALGNGWAIGAGEEYTDRTYQDDVESGAIYDLLEVGTLKGVSTSSAEPRGSREGPIMSGDETVTYWLGQFQAGDRAAAQRLWERYFRRLVGLARKRLEGAPRQAADEEDVALSAFDSFCRGAERGRFPRLEDRNDLWRVLVTLTVRKAHHL